MAHDDDVDPGTAAETKMGDPGAEAEQQVRDLEAELHERHGDPEAKLADRVSELSEADAPGEVSTAFWMAAIYANVAVALLAVGPMLVYFEGRTLIGAGLIVAGLFTLVRTHSIYRSFRERDPSEADDDVEAVDDDNDDEAGDVDNADGDAASDDTVSRNTDA